MRNAFLRAFGQFPDVQFLCKLDNGSIQNSSTLIAKLPNVHTFEWLPQTTALAHPNMRAFITHCGWNSVSEAAQAGVPVIGVPLFGDQWYNSLVAIHTGMGIHLNVRHLNGENADQIVANALEKVRVIKIIYSQCLTDSPQSTITPECPAHSAQIGFVPQFGPREFGALGGICRTIPGWTGGIELAGR